MKSYGPFDHSGRIRKGVFRVLARLIVVWVFLLMVAVNGFWIRSYRWSDAVGIQASEWSAGLSTARGDLYFSYESLEGFVREPGVDVQRNKIAAVLTQQNWEDWIDSFAVMRFQLLGVRVAAQPSLWGFVVPFWILDVFVGFPTVAIAWWRLRYYRRRRPKHCVNCGYDLRYSADRCPECGSRIEAELAETACKL